MDSITTPKEKKVIGKRKRGDVSTSSFLRSTLTLLESNHTTTISSNNNTGTNRCDGSNRNQILALKQDEEVIAFYSYGQVISNNQYRWLDHSVDTFAMNRDGTIVSSTGGKRYHLSNGIYRDGNECIVIDDIVATVSLQRSLFQDGLLDRD